MKKHSIIPAWRYFDSLKRFTYQNGKGRVFRSGQPLCQFEICTESNQAVLIHHSDQRSGTADVELPHDILPVNADSLVRDEEFLAYFLVGLGHADQLQYLHFTVGEFVLHDKLLLERLTNLTVFDHPGMQAAAIG